MKQISKIRESEKVRNDPDAYKRVDHFHNTLKKFKDTEKEIKQLELLDVQECQTLNDTMLKTQTKIQTDGNNSATNAIASNKVMFDDGFTVMIKNVVNNTNFQLEIKDWRRKMDDEIKEIQTQFKKDLNN